MLHRKLIALGDSTFAITIPKRWVLAQRLGKGDTVAVQEFPGRLEIAPAAPEGPPPPKLVVIPLGSKPIKEVEREFVAAYLKGCNLIELVGPHEGKVSEIRRRLHNLIAVEVMEVAAQKITAHVFSDLSTVSLPKIISRIEVISRTIFEDTQGFLKGEGNQELRYKEIMEKKLEVDRQSLFAIRIIIQALSDPAFASKVEADPLRLSMAWHLVETMEKISDYLLSVAFDMASTDVLTTLKKAAKDELFRIFQDVKDNYELALKSYNTNDVALANEVFEAHTRNGRKLYHFLYSNLSLWLPTITGYLRRASSRTRDIARLTINLNTGEAPKGGLG
ncbi:MAG: hypothetical protein HY520_00145 [Candidatus Aenigmarchaeota archaeon]|nr:hypothetical protein [Candidatus Aenigmarchaeota archaeon]